jgi:hypothetical protein
VHAFVPRVETGPAGEPSMPEAAEVLERTGADAVLFLTQQGEISVVRIWIRRGGALPALFEAIALHRTDEVPTMLAARAVDLLQAELARAARAPIAATTVVAAPPIAEAPRWSLQLGTTVLADVGGFGAGVGPEAAFAWLAGPRWAFAARVSGPTWGSRASTPEASATLVQGLATLEAWATLLQGRWLSLRGLMGAGALVARADGAVEPGILSLRAQRSDRVTFAATLGLEAELALGPRVALVAAVRAVAPLPPVSITVGRDERRLGPVLPAAALGVRFAF